MNLFITVRIFGVKCIKSNIIYKVFSHPKRKIFRFPSFCIRGFDIIESYYSKKIWPLLTVCINPTLSYSIVSFGKQPTKNIFRNFIESLFVSFNYL